MDIGTELSCEELIISNNFLGVIVDYMGEIEEVKEKYNSNCVQAITTTLAIVYVEALDVDINFIKRSGGYRSFPDVYGLLDTSSMEESGVLQIRNQIYINLLGKDVIIGFVDTGIDYTHRVFTKADNTTRILSIWDQTRNDSSPPEGLLYGVEYTKEDIDVALKSENPLDIVPVTDEIGHGTFMAGIAAGNIDANKEFSGVAPLSDIVVVKLRQVKEVLRNVYRVKEAAPCYDETDIMQGIKYLTDVAIKLKKPLVLCLGIGTNLGDHSGSSRLGEYLEEVGENTGFVVAAAAGNEGNAGHHYESGVMEPGQEEDVEITVAENESGFFVELWSTIPFLFSVGLISPSGEFISKIPARIGGRDTIRFLLENTIVSVLYEIVEVGTGDELIIMRFEDPSPGIWRIRVYNESPVGGLYNMWLPITGFIEDQTYFIKSSPDITICEPANANGIITSSTYNHNNGSVYINSSRGYTRYGRIKPDFASPGVGVYGPVPKDNFSTRTGSSIASAHTAGAAALLLEWGIVKENDLDMDSFSVKSYMIRGAVRNPDIIYPNREWGYGRMNIFQTFEALRVTL